MFFLSTTNKQRNNFCRRRRRNEGLDLLQSWFSWFHVFSCFFMFLYPYLVFHTSIHVHVLFLFSYSAFDAIQTNNQNKQTTYFTAQLRSSLRTTTFSFFFLVCQMIDGQTSPREKTKGKREREGERAKLDVARVSDISSLSHPQTHTHTHTHYSNRV